MKTIISYILQYFRFYKIRKNIESGTDFSAKSAERFTIYPFKYNDQWVFTDQEKGLDKEPLVEGADTLLDTILNSGIYPIRKFKIVFSQYPYMDRKFTIKKVHHFGDDNGTDYYSPEFNQKLWLCPALLKYFDNPPKFIYFNLA